MTQALRAGWQATRRAADPLDWWRTVRLLGDLFSGGIVVSGAGSQAHDSGGGGPEVWSVIQADGDIQTKILGDVADPHLDEVLEVHLREVERTLQRVAGLGSRIAALRALAGFAASAALMVGSVLRWRADPQTAWAVDAWHAVGGWHLAAVGLFGLLGALARNALMAAVGLRLRAKA